MTEVVVSDTSPLQYLHQSGTFEVLPKLFGRVIVPPAVIGELAEGRARGHDLPVLDTLSWVEIRAPITPLVLPAKLGRGEQEAISVAVERHLPVLIDDRDARTCAGSLGLKVIGIFGVLIKAKRQGLIPAVMPLVDRIAGQGFRMNDATRQQVRALAGESGS
jgi:predicted nucleic acid-binding protein